MRILENFYYKGRKKVLISAFLALFALLFIESIIIKLLFLSIFLFFIYIYYIPTRYKKEYHKDSIYSPIDGYVKDIYEKDDKKYIKIYKRLKDNSILISPIKGDIEYIDIRHGAFLDSESKKSKYLNEKIEINFSSNSLDLKLSLLSSKFGFLGHNLFRNIGYRANYFDDIGFIANADILIELPKNCEILIENFSNIKAGDKIALLKVEGE